MAKLPKKVAAAFNEWQRRYIEDPDGFESSWKSIQRTLHQRVRGEAVTYGQGCAAYLEELLREV